MSRIGKRNIPLPDKVTVSEVDGLLTVKGPLGEVKYKMPTVLKVENSGKELKVLSDEKMEDARSLWGLGRTIIANAVTGVSAGFNKKLSFTGVGYKAAVSGTKLTLNLGYSHPVEYDFPKGISIKTAGNIIEVMGIDKELVGFAAAQIRSFRPPEPYKGKGIKYVDEVIIRKAGKTGGKK